MDDIVGTDQVSVTIDLSRLPHRGRRQAEPFSQTRMLSRGLRPSATSAPT
jgi:hypothetical protein